MTKRKVMVTVKFIPMVNGDLHIVSLVIFTCTEVGREKRSKSDNFEFCPPNVGCDLSEVVVL